MSKTEVLRISSSEDKTSEVVSLADSFIVQEGYSGKEAIHLRLLAEETVGMVKALTGFYIADFWMEQENGSCKVCLQARTNMDKEKKSEILALSSSGKNASAKGFMGKIGEIIENGLLNFDGIMKMHQDYGTGYIDYIGMGVGVPNEYPGVMESMVWSLSDYKTSLGNSSDLKEHAKDAWDELEKSIVASIAKDVIVGVKKDIVDLTIIAW